ncbi:MAG: IS3 family transposase [Actinomycetota bacterium]|nr:IS3 family transposase [Actinomycetota bacterium]
MRLYAFVDAQKTDFKIATLCQVCEVSTSGYYDWVARVAAGSSDAERDDVVLLERIRKIHKKSRGRYGEPRITAQLARDGVWVNHKRVERLMAENGITGRCGRKKVRTTVRDPAAVLAGDLVNRCFDQTVLDTLWVGDATYIPTDEGWLYLATVIDACSRRLLGWSMTDHLRTELCLDALEAAVDTRGGKHYIDGVIFHSDHGCQYTADSFRDTCVELGITQSMGIVGDSYDNAMAESFFASLKRELVDDEHFATRAEARAAVFEWLIWYNIDRLHSSLEYRPPVEYEQHLNNHLQQAA